MPKKAIKILITSLALLMATTSFAHTKAQIAGVYSDGGVDSMIRHYLLPNGDYCFVLMAGILDLNFAGTWQIDKQDKDGTLVKFFPQSLVKTPYPVWLNKKQARDERVVKFITSRMQHAPVFIGFGETDTPSKFAPVFGDDSNLEEQYELAVPKTANYLFVGQPIDTDKFELTRYPLSKDIRHTIQLSYDMNAAYANQFQHLQGKFNDGVMYFGLENLFDDEGIEREPLDQAEIKEVQTGCVTPILKGNPLPLFPANSELLTPTTLIWQGKPTQSSWY